MKMGWINGWAVGEAWFHERVRQIWPEAEHVVVAAGADALARLEAEGGFAVVGGYSLGAHLMLAEPARVSALAGQVVLLAPVFAFAREDDLGGRSGRTQVRHLRRWLRVDPVAALRDFYLRAGLDISVDDQPATDGLDWGLEVLERLRAEPPAPAEWRLYCGDVDDLLDAARLRVLSPGLVVVPGAGHHPGELLRVAAAGVRV
ncbi:MAG: alpha/beta fold hydrolase [Verrucomicrobiota bacterium]